jgi:hypothetical protein
LPLCGAWSAGGPGHPRASGDHGQGRLGAGLGHAGVAPATAEGLGFRAIIPGPGWHRPARRPRASAPACKPPPRTAPACKRTSTQTAHGEGGQALQSNLLPNPHALFPPPSPATGDFTPPPPPSRPGTGLSRKATFSRKRCARCARCALALELLMRLAAVPMMMERNRAPHSIMIIAITSSVPFLGITAMRPRRRSMVQRRRSTQL